MQIFSPLIVGPGNVDETYTCKRVIIDRWPVAVIDPTATVLHAFALELTWMLMVDDLDNASIFVNPGDIFGRGKDIVQMGTLVAGMQVSGGATTGPAQAVPPWNFINTSRNWIDTKINRRINSGEVLNLWLKASVKPDCDGGTPIVPGEDNPACWVIDSDISVLYQRAMRR